MRIADTSDRPRDPAEGVLSQRSETSLQRERLEAKMREHLEREARGKLAEVRHAFAGKLNGRRDRGERVLGHIAARDWHDRSRSLTEIAMETRAWDDLLAEHEKAVGEAANDLLPEDAARQVTEFRAAAGEATADLRRMEDDLRRAPRIEDGHQRRIAGPAWSDTGEVERALATKAAGKLAELLADRLTTGDQASVRQITAKVMDAGTGVAGLADAGSVNVTVPVLEVGGFICFDVGTGLADCDRIGDTAGTPRIELVTDAASWIPPGGRTETGCDAGITELEGEPVAELAADSPPADLGALAVGLVICGSARDVTVALRDRQLSVDGLLSYARRAAWSLVYDGTPGSVKSAMDVVMGLEVIAFVDPDIGGGLWIDVDPVTKAPAAALLIDMLVSSGELKDFRLLLS